ncbi:MAG: hypothetical protein KDA25_12010 [Phycisphaerales bacterium]|nr:hypothetical protein [Phycisphaerales bacterium]
MPAARSNPVPVTIGFIVSIAVHALALLPLLAGVMQPDAGAATPTPDIMPPDVLPPPPDSEPDIVLGRENDHPSTLAWIGYDEYEKHLAALSEVEQSAFDRRPVGGNPNPLAATPELDAPPAEPVPPTETVVATSDADGAETTTERMSITETPIAPVAIEELEPVEPIAVGDLLGTADPTPTTMTDPLSIDLAAPALNPDRVMRPTSELIDTPLERAAAPAWLRHALERLAVISSSAPAEGPPEPPRDTPVAVRVDLPTAPPPPPGDSKPTASDQDAAAKPATEPAAPQTPTPAAAPSAPPGDQAPPGAGSGSDRDASASSVVEIPPEHWKEGKVVVGRGLDLKPSRPNYSPRSLLLGAPSNPLCELQIRRDGRVAKARLMTSTGSREIDEAILNSLYRWTATGSTLELLEGDETHLVRIRMILINRGP